MNARKRFVSQTTNMLAFLKVLHTEDHWGRPDLYVRSHPDDATHVGEVDDAGRLQRATVWKLSTPIHLPQYEESEPEPDER